jgi:hypothetical protein
VTASHAMIVALDRSSRMAVPSSGEALTTPTSGPAPPRTASRTIFLAMSLLLSTPTTAGKRCIDRAFRSNSDNPARSGIGLREGVSVF